LFFTRGVEFNNYTTPSCFKFGKYLEVSSKILKGSCTVIPKTRLFLLVDAINDSDRPPLTERTWAVDIGFSLFRNSFFAVFQSVQNHLLTKNVAIETKTLPMLAVKRLSKIALNVAVARCRISKFFSKPKFISHVLPGISNILQLVPMTVEGVPACNVMQANVTFGDRSDLSETKKCTSRYSGDSEPHA
jgi:hypothetical protein